MRKPDATPVAAKFGLLSKNNPTTLNLDGFALFALLF
jgi:hypothetical protein